jgi:hypothetical protein
MALLFLFCGSIISAVRRWLKTQAAAEMGAANEAMHPPGGRGSFYYNIGKMITI